MKKLLAESSVEKRNGKFKMERQDAINIFPEEIWFIILEYFITGKNLSNIHALPEYQDKSTNDLALLLLFDPRCLQRVSKRDVLETRQICRLWKNIIDKILESERLNIDSSLVKNHDSQFRCLFEMNISKAQKRMNKNPVAILSYFQNISLYSANNPIISRSFNIAINCLSDTLLEFLKIFGKHIWYFTLTIERPENKPPRSPVDIAKFLWRVFECMPNLKALKLIIHQNRNYNSHMSTQQQKSLNMFFEENVFPVLSNLVNLEVSLGPNLKPIQEKRENNLCSQLKYYTQPWCHATKSEGNIDNVKQFCWKTCNTCMGATGCLFENLKKFTSLEKLCIVIDNNNFFSNCFDLCPIILLREIEQHNKKLVNLSLSCSGLRFDFPLTLKLSCLEILNLSFVQANFLNDWSFSFMKYLTKLKILQLHFAYGDYARLLENKNCENKMQSLQCHHSQDTHQASKTEDIQVDILRCLDEMNVFWNEGSATTSKIYNSNIWTQVPSLQVIYVGLVVTRYSALPHICWPQIRKLEGAYYRKILSN